MLQSALSTSRLADLERFTNDGTQTELLEVLAASIRHAQRLLNAVYLQAGLIVSRVHAQPRHFALRSWLRR